MYVFHSSTSLILIFVKVPVTCSGSLFFRITDSYKACYAVSDVHENIRKTGTSAMRSVLGAFTYDQVIQPITIMHKLYD